MRLKTIVSWRSCGQYRNCCLQSVQCENWNSLRVDLWFKNQKRPMRLVVHKRTTHIPHWQVKGNRHRHVCPSKYSCYCLVTIVLIFVPVLFFLQVARCAHVRPNPLKENICAKLLQFLVEQKKDILVKHRSPDLASDLNAWRWMKHRRRQRCVGLANVLSVLLASLVNKMSRNQMIFIEFLIYLSVDAL